MNQISGLTTTFAGMYPSSIKDTTAEMIASRQRQSQSRNAAESIRNALANSQADATVPESASERAKAHLHLNVTI